MSLSDTIFALATPPGKSGVAIIRLSGTEALSALTQLTGKTDWRPAQMQYSVIRHPSSVIEIDRCLAVYFKSPHSFTGEDVVELHIHGSLAVIRECLAALSEIKSLRPAEPGEFTRRAFMNGKMDLIEAEGLADLIAAETSEQKSQALRQMGGALSEYYENLRTGIIRILAHLEAYIDFPDEEIPESVLEGLERQINEITATINAALDDHHRGERLRDGIHIVILGAPNAGKSSLLNALARRDAAIVSTRAGTTRDIIEVHMELAGYPVILSDTAGIRESSDEIEAEGIARALKRASEADIKLVLFDGTDWPNRDPASVALLGQGAIAVVSKCDLLPPPQENSLPRRGRVREGALSDSVDNNAPLPASPLLGEELFISTTTNQGIESLLKLLEDRIITTFSGATAPLITRNRHRHLLNDALSHLEKSEHIKALELKCEELRLAASAIGAITGKIQVDDIFDVVFGQFCIGK